MWYVFDWGNRNGSTYSCESVGNYGKNLGSLGQSEQQLDAYHQHLWQSNDAEAKQKQKPPVALLNTVGLLMLGWGGGEE